MNDQQILSLIEDTQEFTLLDNHFKRFNPLKVLNVDNYEIRHSNVLAWLLNPTENHGQGTYLVNKLIAKVFVNPVNLEEDKLGNYDILQLSRNNYQDLSVYKEYLTSAGRRIDLLAVSNFHKVIILIENKYRSTESEGQLEDYIEGIRSESKFKAYKIIPIYLTLLDESPTHEDYLMLGYSDILGILKNLIEANEQSMNSEVHKFISYYIENLEDQLIRNNELNEIGLQLYQNHKEAINELHQAGIRNASCMQQDIYTDYKGTIDFIKKVGDSILKEAFTRFSEQLGLAKHLYKPHFRVPSFIQQKWFDSFEEEDMRENWWMNKGLIAWFELANEGLKLKLEVGPLTQEKRIKLLQALKNRDVAVRDLAFEEGRKYTRIYMDIDKLSKLEDVDVLVDSMNNLFHKAEFQSLLKKIEEAIDGKEESVLLPTLKTPLEQAFSAFATSENMNQKHFTIHKTMPNFVLEEWTAFPNDFNVIENYWLGYPLIAWFSRRVSTVRLIVEVGPLVSHKRIQLLEQIEKNGVPVRALAYEEGRRYTRIYSYAVPVEDLEDPVAIERAMKQLVSSLAYKETMVKIKQAIKALH